MKKLVLALFVLTIAAGALDAKPVKNGYKQDNDYKEEEYKQDNDYQQEEGYKQDNDYQEEEYKGDECD